MTETPRRPSRPSVLWPAGIVFLTGEAGNYVAPLVVAPVARSFALSEALIAPIIGGQLAAYAVSAVVVSPWLASISPRRGLAMALALIASGNLASAFATGVAGLTMGRLTAGFGEGAAVAVATAVLSRTEDPDRAFAYVFLAVVLMSLAIFLGLSEPMAGMDAKSIYLLMTAIPALACFAFLTLPGDAPSRVNRLKVSWSMPALLLCAAVTLFAISANSYWVYLERIASSMGMTPASYGKAFAIGAVSALAGPLAARYLGLRLGRSLPLSVGCVLVGIGGWLAAQGLGPLPFVAGVTLSSAALMFASPYFLGLAAEVDPSGGVAGRARGFNAFGAALAPIISGAVLGWSGTYRSIGWAAVMSAAAALMLLLFITRQAPAASANR